MKTKKILLVIFTVAFCAATALFLTGCGSASSKRKYDYLVTFDYNVEGLGETNVKTQYLGVNKNSKIVEPGYFGNELFEKGLIAGYFNDGWYTAKLDENGAPLKDENGRVQVDKKWDFKNDVVTSDMTLYANFRKNITFTIVVEGGENKVFNGAPGASLRRPTRKSEIPSKEGSTFIDYYTDETYTTKFTFPYTYTDEDARCYAKFIEGEWELIETVEDFMDLMVGNITKDMYVLAEELDFTGVKFVDPIYKTTFFGSDINAKFYGNGCVFKNMTVEMKVRGSNDTYAYSLFKTIGERAEIKDVTFENLKVSITTIASVSLPTDEVALFANVIEEGAKIENVAFRNCTLEGKGSVRVDLYKYCVNDNAGISSTIFDDAQLNVIDGFTASSGTETKG